MATFPASYKLYLRTETPRKNGAIPVYLRVTVGRKKKDYSLSVSILEPDKYWDPIECRMKTCSWQLVDNINEDIESAENKVRNIFHSYKYGEKKDTRINIELFDADYRMNPEIRVSFYAFAENEITLLKQKNASKETIRSYNSYISKLKKYSPTLSFGEITRDFINAYHAYMVSNGNKKNTTHKALSWMRTLLKRAIENGIIRENPMQGIILSKEPGTREALTSEELAELEKLLLSDKIKGFRLRTLKSFLFCCYTGLRYSDVKNIRFNNLSTQTLNGKQWRFINLEMQKTQTTIEIPLIDKAVSLIDESLPHGKIFRVPSNQAANRSLKDLADSAKIKKTVTFHVSRHTFAVIAITEGFPIEVVSKLMGHTDLKTTMIYAKVVNKVKAEYMDRLNK